MTKHILQVGMSPYYGGTESYIMNLYRNIDRSIIQFDFLNTYDAPLICEDEIRRLGGKIYRLDIRRRTGYRNYKMRLRLFFDTNKGKFDGIQCNYQSLSNIDLIVEAKRNKIPLRIAHVHAVESFKGAMMFQKIQICINRILLPFYATSFFACSDFAAQKTYGKITARKTIICHNAINTKQFHFNQKTRDLFRNKYGINENFVLLFVGRLTEVKNVFFLVDILEELKKIIPDVILLVAGDGELKEQLAISFTNRKLENCVRFLGTRKDIPKLMMAADAFILPSFSEGLGIVLVEAQSTGLVCYTNGDGVPLDVNITGLVSFLNLTDGAKVWSEKIACNAERYKRDCFSEIVAKKGYDCSVNGKEMMLMYQVLLRDNR